MHSFNTFGLLAAVILFQTAHSLNACPGTDSVFVGTQGIRYRICPNTDLVGLSVSVYPNIASTTACAKLCDGSLNCFKAVYDTQGRSCHFKDHRRLNWVDNRRFVVIQTEQVDITRCPYDETTQKAGGVSIHSPSNVYCTDTVFRKPTRFARIPIFEEKLHSSSTTCLVRTTAHNAAPVLPLACKLFLIPLETTVTSKPMPKPIP